ncbi:hypothetical protein [Oscillatoria salina]|uniref:hypothetical protein n=1 Tax=Oscillatoria salina TaxID=331517 RepID=UPI0013B88424|nr:hypothetical protein [Oscillatoria salina]MBZ8178677.1 hypothetical protein [Oscillatoria salina IIICB1]NET90476.1 hypothetical protein [Kamptonema sp. SIO1D9]
MAIIALKAWYLPEYEPIREVIKRPHNLRLNRNSLLKSGLRADFLDEIEDVQTAEWFGRYLEGETVEFYIEGSGGYAISNIDLTAREIYFTKQEIAAILEPAIFFCWQREYPTASNQLREVLLETIEELNQRSRLSLTLQESPRPSDNPMRLSSAQLRQIRKCLLFVADATPVARLTDEEETTRLLPSPNVCIEIGYAMQSKRTGEVLLAKMERPGWKGEYPFDLPNQQQLSFTTATELSQTLPPLLLTLLRRFNLF